MKKILCIVALLILVLVIVPFNVSACSPIPLPEGVIVEIEDCDSNSTSLDGLEFVLLVKRSEVVDVVMDSNDEWVEYLDTSEGRYLFEETYCGVRFDPYGEFGLAETFTQFKVAVYKNGSFVTESGRFSTNIGLDYLDKEKSTYKVIYDEDDSSFSLQRWEYDWDQYYNSCGMGTYLSAILYVFLFFVGGPFSFLGLLFLLYVEYKLFAKFRIDKKQVYKCLSLGVLVLIITGVSIFLDSEIVKILTFISMALTGVKYVLNIKYYKYMRFNIALLLILPIFLLFMSLVHMILWPNSIL